MNKSDKKHRVKEMKEIKVLKVIHGYPPYYMAGSEVYSRNLVRELSSKCSVAVFSRIENPYRREYEISVDENEGERVYRVNKPQRDYTFEDKYLDAKIDELFRKVLSEERPSAVHFGHLSHLSSRLPIIAKEEYNLPIVFTVHDFWMFCFRGQAITPDCKICYKAAPERCFGCAKRFFKETISKERIKRYRKSLEESLEAIDLFLIPSRTLLNFYADHGIPKEKLIYSPYGFDKSLATYGKKTFTAGARIKFGYMGRIIPAKGVHILLEAFNRTKVEARLNVYGSTNGHQKFLEEFAPNDKRVSFEGPYNNDRLAEILGEIDLLIAPSIWLENSPLVIQEAFLAGVPVITSNVGGMAELVEDGKNGFLFPIGDASKLAELIEKIASNPSILNELSPDPDSVRDIKDDAKSCLEIYRSLISAKNVSDINWRRINERY